MDREPKQPVESSPAEANIDLYCLECGYNLRGLSGDPRRCPECGFENPVGDIEMPAALITAQLRRMETAPTTCVAVFVLAMPFAVVQTVMLAIRVPSTEWLFCPSFVLVFAAAAWIHGASRFQEECRARPGWMWALFMYHVVGVLLVAVILAIPVGALFAIEFPGSINPLGVAAYSFGALAIAAWGSLWGYRRAIDTVHRLQREVAVELAREHARRQMAQKPTRWMGFGFRWPR